MSRLLCFSILMFLCAAVVNASPPAIGSALQQLLAAQADHMAAGGDDRTAFNRGLNNLAEKGDAVAQFLLAVSDMNENAAKQEKLLLNSASGGCVGAAGLLGLMYIDNQQLKSGSYWLRYAAENGDAGSQVMLANFYLAGENNFEQDLIEGLAWLRLAEKQAHSSGAWTYIIIRVSELERSLASQDKSRAINRFRELETRIPFFDYHLCGQSQPGRNRDFTNQNYEKLISQNAQ